MTKERVSLSVKVRTHTSAGPNTRDAANIEIYYPTGNITAAMVREEVQKRYPNCPIEVTLARAERFKKNYSIPTDDENIAQSARFGEIEVYVTLNTMQQAPRAGEPVTANDQQPKLEIDLHSPQTQHPWKIYLYLGVGAGAGTVVGAITSTILAYTTDLSHDLVFGVGIPAGFVLGLLTAGAVYYGATRQTSLA